MLEKKPPFFSSTSGFSSYAQAAQYVASRILLLSSERGISIVRAHLRQVGISLIGVFTILNASVALGGVQPQSTARLKILPWQPGVTHGNEKLARAQKPRKVRKISTCTRPSFTSASFAGKKEDEQRDLTRLKNQPNIVSFPFSRTSGA